MLMMELFGDWPDQVEYEKGDVIFNEQDPADCMYVVTEGEVEVSLKGEPLGAELPGGIIGEMAMINAKYRSATAVAIQPSTLARINREQFREMIIKSPDCALHVMAVLANRLRVANMLLAG
ncbi:MAG: cyclic nucleotide-binding domain-containing protein [Xanthomonadales bacterium]|nr:cyclic nucleotide-binding domain-containing protein [Xanthomonadales bacterium]